MRVLRPLVEFARRTLGAAKRSIDSLPWIAGGPRVSATAAESALSLIPFFACVRLLSEQISSLPLHAYRRDGDVLNRITDPALLAAPASRGTRVAWVRRLVVSLAMRGNAYGLVTGRDGFGFPTSVEWLHPDEVHVDESMPTMPVYYWLGNRVPREQVVHIVWFPQPGRVKGLSPVSAFAASIGVGLKAVDYGATWFDNGGTPPGTFKNTAKTLNPDEAEVISDKLTARIRRGRPLVYGSDWDFSALKVNPEESQFIQTMRMSATQMANIFGIPPEMVGGETGGSLTYNSPEQNGAALLKFTLRPWLDLIESELTALLPARQLARFNADGIVRADIKTRYEAHKIGLDAGFLTVNEVRALEDLPPVPGGDKVKSAAPPKLAPTGPPTPPDDPTAAPNNVRGRINGHKYREFERV